LALISVRLSLDTRPERGYLQSNDDWRAEQPTRAAGRATLDLLILQTLAFGPAHGHAIARIIQQRSDEVLQVGHGSLYPALQRLLRRGVIVADDGLSENNRKARLPAHGAFTLFTSPVISSSKWLTPEHSLSQMPAVRFHCRHQSNHSCEFSLYNISTDQITTSLFMTRYICVS